jgi:hypothetical protein
MFLRWVGTALTLVMLFVPAGAAGLVLSVAAEVMVVEIVGIALLALGGEHGARTSARSSSQ